MWLIMLVGAVLWLVGFLMWLFGVDGVKIIITLAVIAAVCLYAYLATCIYLVALVLTPDGSAVPIGAATSFMVLVAAVHWRVLKR